MKKQKNKFIYENIFICLCLNNLLATMLTLTPMYCIKKNHCLPQIFKTRPLLLFVLMIFTSLSLSAQAFEGKHAKTHQPADSHFRTSLVLSHTLIPVEVNGKVENLYIPSWGLDLEYWFSHKWGIGLHNDVELETFEIQTQDFEIIERLYPVVLTLDVLWKPWRELVLLTGPGIEIERGRNLQVFRFGTEYEISIAKNWDIAPSFYYDMRMKAYDTWSLGIGIGRIF